MSGPGSVFDEIPKTPHTFVEYFLTFQVVTCSSTNASLCKKVFVRDSCVTYPLPSHRTTLLHEDAAVAESPGPKTLPRCGPGALPLELVHRVLLRSKQHVAFSRLLQHNVPRVLERLVHLGQTIQCCHRFH